LFVKGSVLKTIALDSPPQIDYVKETKSPNSVEKIFSDAFIGRKNLSDEWLGN
jgi:hypothetical protein